MKVTYPGPAFLFLATGVSKDFQGKFLFISAKIPLTQTVYAHSWCHAVRNVYKALGLGSFFVRQL
jgi:hypothetical protein